MGDREESPDWLRSFQAPTLAVTTLSSDSDASADTIPNPNPNPTGDETTSTVKPSNKKRLKIDQDKPSKRRKTQKHNQPGTKVDDDLKCEESLDKPTGTPAQDHSVWALSSDSESDTDTAIGEEGIHDEDVAASKITEKEKPPKKQLKLDQVKPKRKKKISSPVKVEELMKEEEQKVNEASTSKVVKKRKSPLKRLEVQDVESADNNQAKEPFKMEDNEVLGEVGDVDAVEEGLPEKHIESRVSSSTLALLLPEKVSRCKVLVECEGESIDLSGDMGAVGRVIIPDTSSGEPEMFLDLKGTIYRTTIVPSRTFCVVSVGQSEAKIEAIMNDFVQLKAQSNVYDAETMVEGTLEGFSFDSEDETDKVPKDVKADQNEGAEEQTGKKPKGKQEKKAGGTQKKGKTGGGKQLPKKRKPQATKKSKAKK
ncbi:uncharacterized protein LOC141606901 [Silene latifolia]|uniref:uncharacterized protein LOC141606901 n=1 Tax=Silene latifolia TaxID=37657 RepID=UPI003D76E2CE